MARRSNIIVGLDLGSIKTCALVCKPNAEGKLEVAGLGIAESKGWRKGMIVNLDLTSLAVKKALEAAEAAAAVSIESAYVGVGGRAYQGSEFPGSDHAGKNSSATREVEREDMRRVSQTAQGITLPEDRQLLEVLPQEFLLDSQDGIRDPVGMVGSRLEVNVHLVTGSISAHQNVVTAVNHAGVEVLGHGLRASGRLLRACLTADERELGVALVDIGGGTTDMIIYHGGVVRHSAVIPVGGEHFTNDIAVGLRTPIPEAEKMKKAWGDSDLAKLAETMVEVPSVGERPSRVVTYSTLSEIIEPRAMELVELIQAEIGRSGCEKQLGAGMVLTGGGAKLGGFGRPCGADIWHAGAGGRSRRVGSHGRDAAGPGILHRRGAGDLRVPPKTDARRQGAHGTLGKFWSQMCGAS